VRGILSALFILGSFAAADVAAQAPRYSLDVRDSQHVVGVVTYTVSCPKLQASEWALYAAAAPELPGQSQVKTTMVPAGVAEKEKSSLARGVLLARFPAKTPALKSAMSAQITYDAMLHARTVKPLPAGAKPGNVPDLTAAERKRYLVEYGDMDFAQGAFKKWLQTRKLLRGPQEDAVDFARRVFLDIKSKATYDYKPTMDRHASVVCQGEKSDCGGLSTLFVSALRANKIPARALYGRWATSAKPDEKLGTVLYYQWHVKAEFFADGVGWVPVDITSALLYDQSKEGVKYFGADPGDFIVFHVDANLELDSQWFGVKPMHSLQIPAWWVTGKGAVDGDKITEDWKVKVVK
jgi:transglutaminase-like putative cysteine protease